MGSAIGRSVPYGCCQNRGLEVVRYEEVITVAFVMSITWTHEERELTHLA